MLVPLPLRYYMDVKNVVFPLQTLEFYMQYLQQIAFEINDTQYPQLFAFGINISSLVIHIHFATLKSLLQSYGTCACKANYNYTHEYFATLRFFSCKVMRRICSRLNILSRTFVRQMVPRSIGIKPKAYGSANKRNQDGNPMPILRGSLMGRRSSTLDLRWGGQSPRERNWPTYKPK